jgi:hypothetical protein
MPTPPYRLCGPAVPIPTEDSGAASTLDVTPAIRGILESFRNRGVALNLGSNQVYVGDAVPIIESLGFRVITKSPMSGNGQKNGYLQVTETSVSLWAYADGHTIWEFVDVEALCGK